MSLPYMSYPSGAELVKEAQRKVREEGFVLWPEVVKGIERFEKVREKFIRQDPNKDYVRVTDADLANALYNRTIPERAERAGDDSGWLLDINGLSTDGILLFVCIFLPDDGPVAFVSFAQLPDTNKE